MRLQAILLGQVDDVVVLLPSRPVRFVAAVLEVALAVDFDVFPGEFLAQELEAGVGGHLHGELALSGVHLLLQEDVHAEGADVRQVHRGVRLQLQPRPQQVGGQVGDAFHLGEELVLAGLGPQPLPRGRRRQDKKAQPAQEQQAEPENECLFKRALHCDE